MSYTYYQGIIKERISMLALLTIALLFALTAAIGIFNIAGASTVTPSTNDINRDNGWAHFNVLDVGMGTAEIELVSTRGFVSCFEYRSDGNATTDTRDNFNTDIEDGLWPFKCIANTTHVLNLEANEYIEIRMVFGPEADERFDWTRVDVLPAPSAPTGLMINGEQCGGYTTVRSNVLTWASNPSSENIVEYQLDIKDKNDHDRIEGTERPFTIRDQDGDYQYRLRAVNSEGDVSDPSEWCELTLDRVAPIVSNAMLNDVTVDGAHIRTENCEDIQQTYAVSGQFEFSATIEDDLSGVNRAWYRVRAVNENGCSRSDLFNSIRISLQYDEGLDRWMTPAAFDVSELEDGLYTITIIKRDNAGNQISSFVDLLVDNNAPTVPTITAPGARTWHNTVPILNQWVESVDELSGVAGYQIAYQYDEGYVFSGSTCSSEDLSIGDSGLFVGCRNVASTSRNHTPTLAEQGGVTIWVRAYDNAGNYSEWSDSVRYHYDHESPTTTIDIPIAFAGSSFIVSGSAEDNLALNRVYVQLVNRDNNKRYGGTTINLIGEGPSSEWERLYDVAELGLPDGRYAAHVSVVDRAGNSSSSGWTDDFIIDNTPPLADIDPTPVMTEPGQTIMLMAINVSDDVTGYEWSSTDAQVQFNGSTNDETVQITSDEQGTFTIDLVVTDAAGNTNTDTILATVSFKEVSEDNDINDSAQGSNNASVPSNQGTQQAAEAGTQGTPVVLAATTGAQQPVVLAQVNNGATSNEGQDEELLTGDDGNRGNVGQRASSTQPDNGDVLGVADDIDESGSMTWVWILLAVLGVGSLFLLFARRQAEQE